MSRPYEPRPLAVPASRLSRAVRMGGLTTGVFGSMLAEGARRLAVGERPQARDLLLTPANARRITEQLAGMRGAAMKVGQLLSMEAGDLLPPELAQVLGHLRADAHFLPPSQLKTVLQRNWGADFQRRFRRFDVRPIAAASIGQVHRAQTVDGRDLAIKVQYPGVRAAIDSDVRNVAALLRLSGLLPRGLDISPLLDEARRQLHEEADYQREAEYLGRFRDLIGDDARYLLPQAQADLTTADILAMTFVPGQPIDDLATATQELRNRITRDLVHLMLRELFDFGLMQTDPNFANYRFDPDSGRIVLLDFGAARDLSPDLTAQFRAMLRAALAGDRDGIAAAALRIGYFAPDTEPAHQAKLMALFDLAMGPLLSEAPFDFADTTLATRLRDGGMELGQARDFWHIPPMEVLYIQRKIAGVYLLAARLGARVVVRDLLEPYAA